MRKMDFLLIFILMGGVFASEGKVKKLEKKHLKSPAVRFDRFVDTDGDGVNDLVEKKKFLRGILEIINKKGEKKEIEKKAPITDSISKKLRKKGGRKQKGF